MKRRATMVEINRAFEAYRKAIGRPMTFEEIQELDAELAKLAERDLPSMAHTLGDAPIEPAYHAQMNELAAAIDEMFNGKLKHPDKKVGFVLLTFQYGEKEGRCNFISNGADRKDIVVLFKEMIARFEGQPDMKGRG